MPDDLFQPGETRPIKKSKKVPRKNIQKADGAGQGQKRGIDELDVSDNKRTRLNLTGQDIDTRTRPSTARQTDPTVTEYRQLGRTNIVSPPGPGTRYRQTPSDTEQHFKWPYSCVITVCQLKNSTLQTITTGLVPAATDPTPIPTKIIVFKTPYRSPIL